ncbi:MAG: alkaline phosphatase family protein, partial [Burkholderiales bacterium]|nr:alkaline phosphatase family protein [Burkholderiales bacterium]
MTYPTTPLLLAALLAAAFALPAQAAPVALKKHVLLVSIDGMHAQDLENFIAHEPQSTLAKLAKQGVRYSQARTTAPSDSFPGTLALITGGTPRSTGVYYDDVYDRALSDAASNCAKRGTKVVLDEAADRNADLLDGGGLNPDALPRDPDHGCQMVWPHEFVRVNNAFSVVHAAHGLTAWADKHPAYDLVRGP